MRAAEHPETDRRERLRIADLEARVRDLEETLDAIRSGEVDAIVVSQGETSQVYALEGADHPYRALVENIQEGALTLTATGMVLYGNTAFARMRREPLEHVIGSLLHDHIGPGDRERFDRLLRDALAGPVRGDLRLCSGGGSVPVLFSMTPLEVSGETILSVVVTDRRQDYDRLRLQARMLNAVADAVIATGPTAGSSTGTSRPRRPTGGRRRRRSGGAWTRSPRPSSRTGRPGAARRAARPGQTWSGEFLVRHRDGRLFPVHAHDAPVYGEDGRLIAVISASHDISERKGMERAFTESLARYRQALNRPAPRVRALRDCRGRGGRPRDFVYREVNPAFEAFTGLGSERRAGPAGDRDLRRRRDCELVGRYGRVA